MFSTVDIRGGFRFAFENGSSQAKALLNGWTMSKIIHRFEMSAVLRPEGRMTVSLEDQSDDPFIAFHNLSELRFAYQGVKRLRGEDNPADELAETKDVSFIADEADSVVIFWKEYLTWKGVTINQEGEELSFREEVQLYYPDLLNLFVMPLSDWRKGKYL
jgi:hypothetical protein